MYCKAGFPHISLEDCEHVVSQNVLRPGFTVPDDFYSEEAMAARRAENKLKYVPMTVRHEKKIKPEVNKVTELPF